MVRPGHVITVATPPDVESVQVTLPDSTVREVPATGGRLVLGDTYQMGPYSFQVYKDRAETYVVNLLDSQESNTAPSDEIVWGEQAVQGKPRALKENREIWSWFAMLALLVLMVEWYIYNRRVYV